MKRIQIVLLLFACMVAGCSAGDSHGTNTNDKVTFFTVPEVPDGAEVITLGAGCFWCTEAIFQQVPGVISVTSGYTGGTVKNPTYELVCTGLTGHAEVSRIVFDPKKTSLEKILAVFWEAHDPTSLNRQGADSGTQYRSAIFYYTDEQRQIAEKSKAEAAKEFSQADRHRDHQGGGILSRRGLSSELLPAQQKHKSLLHAWSFAQIEETGLEGIIIPMKGKRL